MISHLHIGAADFDEALRFYSAVLPILGWRPRFVDRRRAWAGWMPEKAERPLLLVGTPIDGEPAASGNGHMVALLAPSRASVNAFHKAAIANSAVCDGPPGLRPQYHSNFYGAYVRDPGGNKICACCHDAPPDMSGDGETSRPGPPGMVES